MKFQVDHDYHIHSQLSSCSRHPEQTPARILQYAKDHGLKRICLTDHYWDSAVPGASKWYEPQNFDHIAQFRALPQADGIEFLFGCETDMDKFNTVGIPASRFDDFAFIIVPTTHLHMKGFTISEEDYCVDERVASLWVERFDALLQKDLPFHKLGVAHLTCYLMNKASREAYLHTLDLIPTEEMERLFTKAAALGCGIEINTQFQDSDADRVLRIYRIAKGCGCKFYFGGDAHGPDQFEELLEFGKYAVELLGLTEDDKFHIGV
ncbi:MAG: PHP domain-containing protein [Ruminococcaceae bacterium]|nr:PHP domain-containing protein [Oscillospiraceae bacterium]